MRTSADTVVYLDSSALVKLVVREPESGALRDYLRDRPRRTSSGLSRVEVQRAVRPHGSRALTRAHALLERLNLIRLDDTLLDQAARLDPLELRSLDVIHLAAARSLGEQLGAVVTYDARMARAARRLDLRVDEPR